MGKRREGREAAVQYLYQLDLHGQDLNASVSEFWDLRTGPSQPAANSGTRAFAEQLVAGVAKHAPAIDELIKKYAANYELHRIAAVDRNIIRLAIYEMLHCDDVPPVVAINEAIEIAKKFGSDESGRFVNGILDRVRGDVNRPAREAGKRHGSRN